MANREKRHRDYTFVYIRQAREKTLRVDKKMKGTKIFSASE